MTRIKINRDSLSMALEDHGGQMSHFLDKKTGEIVEIFHDFDFDDDENEGARRIDAEPERYLEIDPISSHEGFRIMENFVESLPEGEAKLILSKALSWKKPFSNFKEALYDYPDIREEWFEFHNKALSVSAAEWLEEEGIDAELVLSVKG